METVSIKKKGDFQTSLWSGGSTTLQKMEIISKEISSAESAVQPLKQSGLILPSFRV